MKNKKNHDRKVLQQGQLFLVSRIDVESDRENVIKWTSDDTDFSIWFPPLHDPMEAGLDFCKKGKTLTRTVRADAKSGSYKYCIYCYKNDTYAVANSEPEIIVP